MARQSPVMGIIGLIIGVPTLFLFWIPLLGWLMMMAGLGISITGLVIGKQNGQPMGLAIAAVVLNSIPLAIHIAIAILVILLARVLQIALSELLPF